jgi:hypothetical protein
MILEKKVTDFLQNDCVAEELYKEVRGLGRGWQFELNILVECVRRL